MTLVSEVRDRKTWYIREGLKIDTSMHGNSVYNNTGIAN